MSSDFTRQMLEQLLLPHFSKSDVQERIHAYAHPYRELIAYYRCAMMHVETKFNILDPSMSLDVLKRPMTLFAKMAGRNAKKKNRHRVPVYCWGRVPVAKSMLL